MAQVKIFAATPGPPPRSLMESSARFRQARARPALVAARLCGGQGPGRWRTKMSIKNQVNQISALLATRSRAARSSMGGLFTRHRLALESSPASAHNALLGRCVPVRFRSVFLHRLALQEHAPCGESHNASGRRVAGVSFRCFPLPCFGWTDCLRCPRVQTDPPLMLCCHRIV